MHKLILLLSIVLLTGCVRNGRMETITAHQVVNDNNIDEPIGYFQISSARWVSSNSPWDFDNRQFDKNGESDITVQFTNTCTKPVSFNFVVAGKGWHMRDAVVNLSPNQVYTSQRINAPYDAIDYWRACVADVNLNSRPKRVIPSN